MWIIVGVAAAAIAGFLFLKSRSSGAASASQIQSANQGYTYVSPYQIPNLSTLRYVPKSAVDSGQASSDAAASDTEGHCAAGGFAPYFGGGMRSRGPRRPTTDYTRFDADSDGVISAEEKARADAEFAEVRAKHEARKQEMMAKFDTDGDGKLSDTERQKARESREKMMQDPELKQLWQAVRDAHSKFVAAAKSGTAEQITAARTALQEAQKALDAKKQTM